MADSSDDEVGPDLGPDLASSDEEDDAALVSFDLKNASTDPAAAAVAATTDKPKRGPERGAADDEGGGRAKRIRLGSAAAREAERNRVQIEEEAAEARMLKMVRQREKVLSKSFGSGKGTATDLLKKDPKRAEIEQMYKELEGTSFKDLKRAQEAKAMELEINGVEALTADRQRVVKSSRVVDLPQLPPSTNVFPGPTVRQTEPPSASATDPVPELTKLVSDVHRLACTEGGDPLLVEFLRSGAIEAAGFDVELPATVADWLVGVMCWLPDTMAAKSCVSALTTCFLSRKSSWRLSADRLALALRNIGATLDSLHLEDPTADGGAVSAARRPTTPAPPPTAALPLLNLQCVVEVVETAARLRALSSESADVEAMILLLFRVTADTRTVPLLFAIERAVTELLCVFQDEEWAHTCTRIAGMIAANATSFHQLVHSTELLSAQSTRGRDLRIAILDKALPNVFPHLELELPDASLPVDAFAYFDKLLKAFTPHVNDLASVEKGYYKLFCLHQIMDASLPPERRAKAELKTVARLANTVADYRSKFRGEYDISRADVRDIKYLLKATHGRLNAIVEYSVWSNEKKQTSMTAFLGVGSLDPAGAAS
mmetsp:Transcript_21529/g.64055  ORF Transcript_21529/g.64055 Transcript_21529/m.64055 type:complete len:602 (+) Transcript_21529:195-2000(+)